MAKAAKVFWCKCGLAYFSQARAARCLHSHSSEPMLDSDIADAVKSALTDAPGTALPVGPAWQPRCAICGEPMPKGEEMFVYHGYSGGCPKPPLARMAESIPEDASLRAQISQLTRSNAELVKALEAILPMAEATAPRPSHEGGCCPPHTSCDGDCVDASYAGEILHAARAALKSAAQKE